MGWQELVGTVSGRSVEAKRRCQDFAFRGLLIITEMKAICRHRFGRPRQGGAEVFANMTPPKHSIADKGVPQNKKGNV